MTRTEYEAAAAAASAAHNRYAVERDIFLATGKNADAYWNARKAKEMADAAYDAAFAAASEGFSDEVPAVAEDNQLNLI